MTCLRIRSGLDERYHEHHHHHKVVGYDSNDFHVGDIVHLRNSNGTFSGPYYIATRPSPRKCTLSLMDGRPVADGAEIDIDKVVPVEAARGAEDDD